jgi:tRNA dimethylallyltransferase
MAKPPGAPHITPSSQMKRELHILTGPTAVGKTALALAWAEENGAEIVSCDASLFYRGMDIGTAKPTAAERARVPHHLIDICDVRERMDVTKYVERAREACADIVARGRRVLVTGGSGFYLKAFFGPVADTIAIPEAVRAEVAELERAGGGEALVARLREVSGAGLGAVDLANPRRVARALERCLATGRTAEALAAEFQARPGPFADWAARAVVLRREDGELRARVEARVAAMLRDGLVEEVWRLRAEGIEENPSAAAAIGYRETLAMLRGELEEARLAETITLNTWKLVRKQKTWFRTQLPPGAVREVEAGEARVDGIF